MSKKEERLIKAACEHLGIKLAQEGDTLMKSIKEVKSLKRQAEQQIEEIIGDIERLEEIKGLTEQQLGIIKSLLYQIEVEEYKELNPHAKDVF